MRKKRALRDEYQFPGFSPKAAIQGIFGDPKARVVTLVRRQKKRPVVPAEQFTEIFTIGKGEAFGIYLAEMHGFIWMWRSAVSTAGVAAR